MIPTHVSNVDTCDCFIVEHCCHLLSIQPFPPREENTWKRVETRFRPTIIEAIDSRCRCKKKTISRKGSSWLEERTRARRAVESIAAASSMIRLETFALATLSYSPEGSRHFDSDYDNRATVIYQFIYCHAWINRWFADTRRHGRVSLDSNRSTGFRLKLAKILLCSREKKYESISISILFRTRARATSVGSSLNVILHDLE